MFREKNGTGDIKKPWGKLVKLGANKLILTGMRSVWVKLGRRVNG